MHYGPVPAFNPETWDLRLWGEVEEEIRWTWDEFNQLPRTSITMDIHCVTRWSKFDTAWEGVSVRTLVEQGVIKLRPAAKFVVQHAEYGFTVNLPLEAVLADNFLLATHFDGQPLTADHGAPLRGVIGYISAREDLKYPLFLERGQVAARAGVPGGRPVGFLGAGGVSQRGGRLEGAAVSLLRPYFPAPGLCLKLVV